MTLSKCFACPLAMQGSYAFILYDRSLKRIVAGRSPDGAEDLFWAAGTDKKSLMFSSNQLALFKHGEAVTEFPSKFIRQLIGDIVII